jgi:hypothetical protein
MTRAVALAAAVLLTALPGEAQVLLTDEPIESPRGGGVVFRLGAYTPAIDSEEGLSGQPYEKVFGSEAMLLFDVELERFLYQGVGTAGLSLSAGYAEKYAQALLDDGAQAPEGTSLTVVPLRARAFYKFDYAAFHWGIPLVPYGKLGLIYMPWWTTKGGEYEIVNGRPGRGGRWGYEFVGGLAFLLDVLEPRFARDFDTNLGVNHSYLFAEYTYAKVNSFGAPGLDLSDGYWMFGLALDY